MDWMLEDLLQLPSAFVALMVFFVGASLGSFVNLYVYRAPRMILEDSPESSLSLSYPASFCPHCGAPIKKIYLIPLLGFFLSRGQCASCHQAIAWRYPLIELAYGLAFLAAWGLYPQLGPVTWIVLLYGVFGYPLIAIDLKHQLIPDSLNYLWVWVILLATSLGGLPLDLAQAVLGAVVGFVVLYTVREGYFLLRRREGLGFGDVKLMLPLGALVGVEGLALTLLVAGLVGLVMALVQRWIESSSTQEIAFGPALLLGGLTVSMLQLGLLGSLSHF
jgi:prepilin signal peptidase PulO-like enzyme (type II secretory pathway)